MSGHALPHYDAVVATCNRPEALRMSLPLLVSQTKPPQRLIVVDSSDDHQAVCDTVGQAVIGFNGQTEIIRSKRGLTYQRNVGLKHVQEAIVFFPDDDSLFYPDASEHILRAYHADKAETVGGVCAAEAVSMPGELEESYALSTSDKIKKKLIGAKRTLESWVAPDPFLTLGQELMRRRAAPAWLEAQNAVLVESMTGFRMTYRTEAIKKAQFPEAFVNYGLFEDTEASFSILQNYHLVGARNAQIYHHRFPGARGSGYYMGLAAALNRTYIIAKHAGPDSAARRDLYKYHRYTLARYVMTATDAFGRDRARGYREALKFTAALLAANEGGLDELYERIWNGSSEKAVAA
ncbi:hypothetical protein CAI21_09655 [Alkalilimnicola ehrlichii]|uniref:Glycosyltransferase 2-like domain-containing protein n=1 Tax=Alkalilimnicola ehrlichii TaxID=351052 RepID=A0A3E0WXF2_9GAMM|nr:glycosyltransferase family 2 protein [Alkalilimnicola ehrlichii]RFA29328.1 hypothetical protein CAI21_09655 [Alkalilimnicola ehrlichii]RFA36843.1 hypothetical protein CAL65_09990 [Alkalilimnicola ehrlichii]